MFCASCAAYRVGNVLLFSCVLFCLFLISCTVEMRIIVQHEKVTECMLDVMYSALWRRWIGVQILWKKNPSSKHRWDRYWNSRYFNTVIYFKTLDSLFNSLFRITAKEMAKPRITLKGETTIFWPINGIIDRARWSTVAQRFQAITWSIVTQISYQS